MAKEHKNNNKTGKIKLWQMSSILRILYRHPDLTRMDLSRALKINKSMITWHMSLLRDKGYIVEHSPEEKRIPLRIREDKILVAGVEIQPEVQICVITNMTGKILSVKKWVEPVSDITRFIETTLRSYLQESAFSIKAVGIALPGAYQRSSHTLLASIPFNVDTPLTLPSSLEGSPYPVYYDNDARCAGWGIISFDKERESFILIISEGTDGKEEDPDKYARLTWGAAVCIDGKMRDGSHSCATECGNIFKISDKYAGYEYINYFQKLTMKSDPEVFEKTIREYARVTSFIVNFLDLGKIYIAGMLENYKEVIERQFGHYILKNASYPHIQKTEIAYTRHERLSIARGAAGMAYERLFPEPVLGVSTPLAEEILG